MFESRAISICIECAYGAAYDFMSEPRNLPSWASVPADTYRPGEDGDWDVDLPVGPARVRFSPHNDFGVLDYRVTTPSNGRQRTVPVRLLVNGEGCELLYVIRRRDGMSDEEYRSEVEWITSELMVLKTLLENTRGARRQPAGQDEPAPS